MTILDQFIQLAKTIQGLNNFSNISDYINQRWGGRLARTNLRRIKREITIDIEGKWELGTLDNELADFLNQVEVLLKQQRSDVTKTDVVAFVAIVVVDNLFP